MWLHVGVVIHNTQNIYIPDVKATTRDITYSKIYPLAISTILSGWLQLLLSIVEILRFERYVL